MLVEKSEKSTTGVSFSKGRLALLRMEIPAARFSRALGHKAGALVGISDKVSLEHIQIDAKSFMKIKILMLSSQLHFMAKNAKFREIFMNFKFSEEDLKTQIVGAMRGLNKNELIKFEDYGLIYNYQN